MPFATLAQSDLSSGAHFSGRAANSAAGPRLQTQLGSSGRTYLPLAPLPALAARGQMICISLIAPCCRSHHENVAFTGLRVLPAHGARSSLSVLWLSGTERPLTEEPEIAARRSASCRPLWRSAHAAAARAPAPRSAAILTVEGLLRPRTARASPCWRAQPRSRFRPRHDEPASATPRRSDARWWTSSEPTWRSRSSPTPLTCSRSCSMGMCVDDAPLLRFTPLRDGTLRCAAASRPLPALLWAPLVGPHRVTHAARRAVAFTHCSALFARSHAGAGHGAADP